METLLHAQKLSLQEGTKKGDEAEEDEVFMNVGSVGINMPAAMDTRIKVLFVQRIAEARYG